MYLQCPHCARRLEFTGDPPAFCAYCGKALNQTVALVADLADPGATRPYSGPAPKARQAPPSSIGGYRILKRLGGGGMGEVFEAEETASGHHVALKVIAPECAASGIAIERFRQEGRLASLISHPRCVFVLAADEEAGRPYIVMELMPGTTLQDWVEQNGPLPVQEAVAKIFDVIEGLQEAHRLGVVHRDVKPSNCFLLADGRVKIGDFGLSKSLVSGADLTKTGTFLGTLLYAAPEQIKGDRVDYRTDVYAVAATLYFLLAGQAPFQGKDAAATLARTVSELPTPLRRQRPEVPAGLEKVIRRGLERSPERRWRNLDDFRTALLRFVPRQLSFGAMGLRTGAYVIDAMLFSLVVGLLQIFVVAEYFEGVWPTLLGNLLIIPYFAILEGLWGLTPGKWLLRLRVCTAHSSDPPGCLRAFWRAVLFYVLVYSIYDLATLISSEDDAYPWWGWELVAYFALGIGLLALNSTMRARNGYRGLHELLSGTRVVRLPWPRRSERFVSPHPDRLTQDLSPAEDLPSTIGPFLVRGALQSSGQEQWVLAEDPTLARKVLLHCRPGSKSALDFARRNLHRPTRLRWLSAGEIGQLRWDAYLAPTGCPLRDLCSPQHRLSWRAFRGILEQLTDELVAACADGTLPLILTVEQIWVQPDGRVQVLDASLSPAPPPGESAAEITDERALRVVREAAPVALEGQVRPDCESACPIHAPVPEHAGEILRRLWRGPDAYQAIAQLQADLTATHDRLAEVNRMLRGVHLFFLALALAVPLMLVSALTVPIVALDLFVRLAGTIADEPPEAAVIVVLVLGFVFLSFFPAVWVAWAFLFRGGFTLPMMGLTLVRGDGQRAGRFRCAWRAFVVWAPLVLLLMLAFAIKAVNVQAMIIPLVLWSLAMGFLAVCPALALWFPTRSLHDRLAGTYLVPR
jgi:uncharacterized RDD family membrane protein YckC